MCTRDREILIDGKHYHMAEYLSSSFFGQHPQKPLTMGGMAKNAHRRPWLVLMPFNGSAI
jgi:hypothetical protein